jgi:hypothetical protein
MFIIIPVVYLFHAIQLQLLFFQFVPHVNHLHHHQRRRRHRRHHHHENHELQFCPLQVSKTKSVPPLRPE